MKRISIYIPLLVSLLLGLTSCSPVTDTNFNQTHIYGIAALLAFLLLIGYYISVKKRTAWFILLFSSVFVVNISYMILSVSSSLEMALIANRMAYLGSVCLPLSMLMIIIETTNIRYHKHLPIGLLCLAAIIFSIVASQGILDIYYKEVSLEIVNGVSKLNKVYGPLHPLYLFYLLGYFGTMVTVIIRAQIDKTIDSTSNAVILAIAVFVNIGVWFIGQLTDFDFEFLSVSYIISELFLLGNHLSMNEHQKLREIVKQIESVQSYPEDKTPTPESMLEHPLENAAINSERIENFMTGLQQLTPTEQHIFDAYIARATSKEVMANMNIKENTLKYHNRNLYSKLGVSSRKELLEIHKQIRSVKSKLDENKLDKLI